MQTSARSHRSRLFGAIVPLLMLMGLLTFAAACSPEPTPTPTPTATPTPAPTPTPTSPPAPSVPFNQLEILPTTTVGELLRYLSEEETSCLHDTLGEALINSLAETPLSALPPDAMNLPGECLSPQSAANMQIAFMSLSAGGLSFETRDCITALALENPALLSGPATADPAAAMSAALQMQLCLTDEEAAAWAASTDSEFPPPSALRCVQEEVGGIDELAALFSGQEPDPEVLITLMTAAMACELDIQPSG